MLIFEAFRPGEVRDSAPDSEPTPPRLRLTLGWESLARDSGPLLTSRPMWYIIPA